MCPKRWIWRCPLGEDGRPGELEMRELGSQQPNTGLAILAADAQDDVFRDIDKQGLANMGAAKSHRAQASEHARLRHAKCVQSESDLLNAIAGTHDVDDEYSLPTGSQLYT